MTLRFPRAGSCLAGISSTNVVSARATACCTTQDPEEALIPILKDLDSLNPYISPIP